MRRIDRHLARETLVAIAVEYCRVARRLDRVVAFEPQLGARYAVLVQRVDHVVERYGILARQDVFDGNLQQRRVAHACGTYKRIGVYGARKGALSHVVDRIEDHDLIRLGRGLGRETVAHHGDQVAQTRTLALGVALQRVAYIVDRIAVTSEDRFVQLQRIGIDAHLAQIGIRQKCVVEDVHKAAVGDILRPVACRRGRKDEAREADIS